MGTMKNREMLPIGARVRPAHDKMSKREGTVTGHSEDERMYVNWDDQPDHWVHIFMPMEIMEVRKR